MGQTIPVRDKYNHFIHGAWVEPANNQYFEALNPSTGEKLADFARGNQDDMDQAVRSAEKGYKEWYALKAAERGQILVRIAHILRENKKELAYLETMDTGRPIIQSEGIVEGCAKSFEYAGGAADKIFGEVIPGSQDFLTYTYREPFGVTGHIIPWNAPISMAARGAASALSAGNSVVMKPAEQAGLAVLELARLCVEAGLPPGAFNVVTGFGEEVGTALISHPSITKISFTGSVQTGQVIMKAAAERIVPVSMELGGKSPNIVFEDADLDVTVKASLRAFITNSGQVCAAGTRLLVQRSVMDAFVERLVEAAKKVEIGCGLENPTIGPLISEEQLDRVLGYLEIGKKEGAQLVCGGNRLTGGKYKNGYFIGPTIFNNVTNTMTIAREEIFGPVVAIIPFDTEEEVVHLANDTEYGLSAAIWTENIHRAHRVAKQLQAGQVYINHYMGSDARAPFGGYKKSGLGREGGMESIREYTQLKTISVKI